MELKWDKYYIAKLSFFKGNPIHESIIYVKHDVKGEETVILFNGLSCKEIRINDLNYFKIIKLISLTK